MKVGDSIVIYTSFPRASVKGVATIESEVGLGYTLEVTISVNGRVVREENVLIASHSISIRDINLGLMRRMLTICHQTLSYQLPMTLEDIEEDALNDWGPNFFGLGVPNNGS